MPKTPDGKHEPTVGEIKKQKEQCCQNKKHKILAEKV